MVIEPITFIEASIDPNLHALTSTRLCPRKPLAKVLGPVLEVLWLADFKLLVPEFAANYTVSRLVKYPVSG